VAGFQGSWIDPEFPVCSRRRLQYGQRPTSSDFAPNASDPPSCGLRPMENCRRCGLSRRHQLHPARTPLVDVTMPARVMVSKTELGFRLPADDSMRRNAPPATPHYAGSGDRPPPRSGRSGHFRLADAVPGNDVALSCAMPPTGGAITPPALTVYAPHRRRARRIGGFRRRPKQVFSA